jgi:HD superfamily phosphohydrolase
MNDVEGAATTTDHNRALDDILQDLLLVYDKYGQTEEYASERQVLEVLVPELKKCLDGAGFELLRPLALGSTATVWVAFDRHLEQERALKIPRPRLGKFQNIISIVRAERKRLAGLSHQNVTRIYYSNEVSLVVAGEQYGFPFFIMDFLRGIKDLDEYILGRLSLRDVTAAEIIAYLRDILLGTAYLHANQIIHCDLKPGNLLIADGTPALVADLGYAKHLPRVFPLGRGALTHVTYTPEFAHPDLRKRMEHWSDPNANIADIPREDLRPAFDLFALGRTLQKLLSEIHTRELDLGKRHTRRHSVFSPYQWQYLELISKRLLDGVGDRRSTDPLLDDSFPGIPQSIMETIRYSSAEEALEDVEKLLNFYDLEGTVPELNPNIASYIQIPFCKVPLTLRVREVLGHPFFMRLMQVTQLGFVSLVYPGATHTRYEHILGVFSECCEYLRALWYDEENPLFRSIMSREDIEVALLAALVHDVAQYPMAHDFTEASARFTHEPLTRSVLERKPSPDEVSLSDIILTEWGISIEPILNVLEAKDDSGFKERILHSIISGPLDCDKIDYIRRDSLHLGVPFGFGIDHERVVRNLTVVYGVQSPSVAQRNSSDDEEAPNSIAQIGVTEKALAAALGVWRGRQDMFRQVYWQHTVRALKAMLAFIVRDVLNNIQGHPDRDAAFRADFNAWLFGDFSSSHTSTNIDDELSAELASAEELFTDRNPGSVCRRSGLHPSDDSVLELFSRHATPAGRKMVLRIRDRSVYRRTAVISGSRSDQYKNIYNMVRNYRLDEDHVKIEQLRVGWENKLVTELENRVRKSDLQSEEIDKVRKLLASRTSHDTILLVDIPIKALSRTSNRSTLAFLPEDLAEIHVRPRRHLTYVRLEMGDEELFDLEVGKIRLFVAPEWSNAVASTIGAERLITLIQP